MSSLLEAIKNKRQAIAAKSTRERPAKLTSAKNIIRILPRWDGDEQGIFYQDFGQHFIKDRAGKVQAVYICTAATFGTECSICAEIARLSAETTDEAEVELLHEARGSSQVLVNAIYLNGPHANAKTDPVLLALPVSVLGDILSIMETYLEDHNLNVLSLAEGYDLVISKTGTGRDTRYNVTPSPKQRAIPASVMEKARNLEEYAKQEYDAGLQKALASLHAVTGAVARIPRQSQPRLINGPAAVTPVLTQAQMLAEQPPLDSAGLSPGTTPPAALLAHPAPAVAQAVVPIVESMDDLTELDALLAEAGV